MVSRPIATIHVLSDSLGETGEMVARAVAAQFDEGAFRIERLPKVSTPEEVRETVRTHCGRFCIFFYTLVTPGLRDEMVALSAEGVNGVDLLGQSVQLLESVTGVSPTGEAGAVHRTSQDYFDRIAAMEFAVKHDDGRNPEGLTEADIVLIGVSRTGKTPLAVYLAAKGFRTANVPLAREIEPPPELANVDPRRLFGLMTDPDVLMEIRAERMHELGSWVPGYAERESVELELEESRALMRRLRCIIIHTGARAIEESAQEIITRVAGGLLTRD